MTPMVTVFQEQRVLGWPDQEGVKPRWKDQGFVVPLSVAMTRKFSTDAHFVQYRSPIGRRMNSASLDHDVRIQLDLVVFDLDCEETHGTKDEVPHTWRVKTRRRMLALNSAHPGLVAYETRGGARLVYRQPWPVVIETPDDARLWRQDYAIMGAYLRHEFGLDVDFACSDWTRFFRCPRATRQGCDAPEDRLIGGNVDAVGSLYVEPADEDRSFAKSKLKNAFDEPTKYVSTFEPSTGDGDGLLFRLLSSRGYLIRKYKSGYLIRCPNEALHSSGRTGDTSTVLYPPSHGQRVGMIHCKHSHCAGMSVVDWLNMFSADEIRQANG